MSHGLGTARRQRRALAALLLAVLAACACAAVRTPVPATGGARRIEDRAPGPRQSEEGLASWYGEWHHGQPTASGEIFDMTRLTAAHRTLPLGTRLRVTNLENGRIVQVRVNDRGPYVAGRVLDLSHRAASALGALERGVVPVKFEIIEAKSTRCSWWDGARFAVVCEGDAT